MQTRSADIFVVIPVYNESQVLDQVLRDVLASGSYKVLVIDDGSSDNSFEIASAVDGVIALRHRINRGKGAAVKTGIMAANRLGADCVVTMDGDGQHNPEDIQSLVAPILKGSCDTVLGTRIKNRQEMPLIKIIANKIHTNF